MTDQPSLAPDTEPVHPLARLREYSSRRWDHILRRVRFSDNGAELPYVEVDYFLDRSGKIGKPAINPGPYMRVLFEPTPTRSRSRRDRQWLALGGRLARDMWQRGLAKSLELPPQITDMRPWHWVGFRTEVLYTYCSDLPYDNKLMMSQIRRSIRKATEQGFTCARAQSLDEVVACLRDTEQRKHFDQHMSLNDLNVLQSALGEDTFRAYICYSSDGEPASASVDLLQPDGRAISWLAGTASAFVGTGAAQLLRYYVLQDLADASATSYDWGGANIPSVAAAKAQWGGTLSAFYRLEGDGLIDIARHVRRFFHFRRAMA